jgi:ABC-type lipoprotein release transport system permease subunit
VGKVLLVGRLAVKDIRHRPAQVILLLLAIAAGTTTLTLGFALRGTTDDPYARTRAATRGPDVVAVAFPGSNAPGPATVGHPGGPVGPTGSADARGLVPLEQASGVAAYSGPFPVTWALLRMGHTTAAAEVEGRNVAPSAVDRPKLLQGSWIRPGGVVVEAAFANSLGLQVGDRLSLGGSRFEVTGIAVTAAIPAYPDACSHLGCFLAGRLSSYNPGLIWATEANVGQIAKAGTSTPFSYFLNLKLSDPSRATKFADRYDASAAPTAPYLYSWQGVRAGDAEVIANVQTVLVFGSWLLALLAVASVVVLVGGRMAEQKRRVGLLKAVGGTPQLVAVVLLFEHLLVGLCAAGVGLAGGWLAAPLLDGPGAGLVGAPSAPALSGSTVGSVIALALAVAIVATFAPAISAARQSTVGALEDSAFMPRRRAAVIGLSAHLPTPLLLGVRLAVRRPRRLLLSVFSFAVTASGLVTVLIWHATDGGFLGARVTQATTVISVMLVVLTGVNTVFIAWATALEARRPAALARALGATPDQITAGLSVAQVLPALVGALLGIPCGLAIFEAPRNAGRTATILPGLWLVVMVAGTLLIVTVLAAIPVRISARRPVTEVLQAETT